MGSSPQQQGAAQPQPQTRQVTPDDLRNQMAQLRMAMQFANTQSRSAGGLGSGSYQGMIKEMDRLRNQYAQVQPVATGARPATLGGLPVMWGPGPPT